jgi:hypothetical protein
MNSEWIRHLGKISIKQVEAFTAFALRCVTSETGDLCQTRQGLFVLSSPALLAGNVGHFIYDDCFVFFTTLPHLMFDDYESHPFGILLQRRRGLARALSAYTLNFHCQGLITVILRDIDVNVE